MPAFIVRRASEHVMDAAVKGLRELVVGDTDSGDA
jgi:hypothetical protein